MKRPKNTIQHRLRRTGKGAAPANANRWALEYSIVMSEMKTDSKKVQGYVLSLLCCWLFAACTPNVASPQPAVPTVSTPLISTPVSHSQTLSAEALSEIIWASDPSSPQYDPDSSAFAEFPGAVKQISDMGADSIDAADDLAVAIRYPRADSYLAAQALLKLGPEITATTIPLLMDHLRNEEAETRIYSFILLASVGERASCAVGDIAPLLWDPDPSVRSATALTLEKITGQDLVESDFEVLITPSFLAHSVLPDSPEGKVVDKARNWWNEQGSTINWHPRYGICDP